MTEKVNSGINFANYAIKLSEGGHTTPQEGMCIMECVAYIVGERHSDHPECADKTCNNYAIHLNDFCTDAQRNKLIKYVMRLAGSRNDALKAQRLFLIIDRVVRQFLSYRYKQFGFRALSTAVSSLPEIRDLDSLKFAYKKLGEFLSNLNGRSVNPDHKQRQQNAFDITASVSRIIGHILEEERDRTIPWEDGYFTRVNVLFTVLNPYKGRMADEEFEMHCNLLDDMLKLTDERQDAEAEKKLNELQTITKDHTPEVKV